MFGYIGILVEFIYCRLFFFFKQKTAYEMRISDWSSDVCSSDLAITLTGTPAISIPAGFTKSGLPVGLQVVARPRSEAELLAFCGILEADLGLSKRLPVDPVAGRLP